MNKINTLLASAVLVSFACAALADPAPPPPANGGMRGPSPEMFQKMKQRIMDGQQKRIQVMQQSATCVQAASNMAQIKDCHAKEHQAMEDMRSQMKAERQSMKPGNPPPPPPK